jgi:hypothetical protein
MGKATVLNPGEKTAEPKSRAFAAFRPSNCRIHVSFVSPIPLSLLYKLTAMKKINILYWTVTGIFAAFMLFSAIPDIIVVQSAVDMVSTQLGYPQYIIPFLGVAKV